MNVSSSQIDQVIQKYGKDNFKIEQIDTADNIEELNEKEVYWIEKLGTVVLEYNIHTGGNHHKTSLEFRKKRSEIQRRLWKDPTYRSKMEQRRREITIKGYKLGPKSEETKRKISKKNKGHRDTDLQRLNKSKATSKWWKERKYAQS